MRIRLNGQDHDLPGPASVAELLRTLSLGDAPVAVAVNRRVVRRGDRDTIRLREGDEVEVIQAVAGG